MKKLPKYARLRRKAARLLEKQGWAKKSFIVVEGERSKFPVGSMCLVGALSMAATGDAEVAGYGDAVEVLGALKAMNFDIDWADGEIPDAVYKWNDSPKRKRYEVLRRLRKGL